MLAGELLERVATGEKQREAAADDVVEAPLAARARDDALNTKPSRERSVPLAGRCSTPSVSGGSSSGGGGPAWRSVASRSAAACGSSWQSTLPSSMARRITASF